MAQTKFCDDAFQFQCQVTTILDFCSSGFFAFPFPAFSTSPLCQKYHSILHWNLEVFLTRGFSDQLRPMQYSWRTQPADLEVSTDPSNLKR